MPRQPTLFVFLFAVLFLSALQPFSPSALSQTVRWEPAGGKLAKGQVSQIQLVFENCLQQGDAALPAVPGLELQPNGSRSTSINTVKGRTTQTVSLGINVTLTIDQPVTIPEFNIYTDKGKLTVPSASFDAGQAPVLSVLITPETVWAGEVFPITYRITAQKRILAVHSNKNPEWNPHPLTCEAWSQRRVPEEFWGDANDTNLIYSTRVIARVPDDITLNAARQVIALAADRPADNIQAVFKTPPQDRFTITSDRPKITVKPLPLGAPKSFGGAVGQFKLESKIVHDDAIIDEPVIWRLTLSGTGNWPQISRLPQRMVSRSFYVMEPRPQRAYLTANDQFEATLVEDVVLVPTKTGAYTLGPVEWTYFDPVKGSYETIFTQPLTLTVTGSRTALSHTAGTQQVGGTPSHRVIVETPNQLGDQQAQTNLLSLPVTQKPNIRNW